MKKMNKKFDRNNAFAINIGENSTDTVDSIQYLINLQDSLYAFADDSISKVLPARSIIQTKQILDYIILNNDIDKQLIIDQAWCCTQLLLNCESAHYKIYDEVIKLMPECDAIALPPNFRTLS